MAPLSIHATLALRHSTNVPTLLSPLRSITNSPLADADAQDDFQSNAWVDARPPLTGLGITYLRDASANLYDQPLDLQDTLHVDCEGPLFCPAHVLQDDFSVRSFGSKGNRREVQSTSNLEASLRDEHNGTLKLGLDTDIDLPANDIIGLIPDINMYDKLRRHDLPHASVNPLDTVCSMSFHDFGVRNGEPALLTPKDHNMDDTFSGIDQIPEPSPRVIQDIMSILVQPASNLSFPLWPCTNSPPAPLRPRSPTSISLEPAHAPNSEPYPLPVPCNFEYTNTNHPSPVFNAHLGIELGDLISRAERFRNKYPDRDIDRTWLSHFAGKLSERGELLNDFRCYVVGCDQRNKRRDHILVHVGAHIGQRPFACSLWFVSSRFLAR